MGLDAHPSALQIVVKQMPVNVDLAVKGKLAQAGKLLGEKEHLILPPRKPRNLENAPDLLLLPPGQSVEFLHDLKILRSGVQKARLLGSHVAVLLCDQGTGVVVKSVFLYEGVPPRRALLVNLRQDPGTAQSPAAVLEHLKGDAL